MSIMTLGTYNFDLLESIINRPRVCRYNYETQTWDLLYEFTAPCGARQYIGSNFELFTVK